MLFAALTLLAGQAATAEPPAAWRRFDGAGVSLDVPPGMLPCESAAAGAYLFDLRRASGVDDRAAFLRVAIVGPATPPEQLAALLLDAAGTALLAEGETRLRGTVSVHAAIAGAERAGERREYERGSGVAWDFEAYAFPLGELVCGVLLKTGASQREPEGALRARVLAGLELREIAGDEPILFRLGRTGVRLPAMAVVELAPDDDPQLVSGQLTLPAGQLTLLAQDCGSVAGARLAEQEMFVDFVRRARDDAAASGGTLALEDHAAGLLAAGGAVIPFQRLALRVQEQQHEVLAAVVRDGDWIFALQLAAPSARAVRATAAFRALLASLDFAAAPDPPRAFAGMGLRFELPALMTGAVYPAPQFILQASADHASSADLPVLFVEWRADVAAAAHPELHARFRDELFPGRETIASGEWSVSGPLGDAVFLVSLPGSPEGAGLFASAARAWRDRTLVIALTMPRSRNANELAGVLEAWFGALRPLAEGERVPLRSGAAVLELMDGEWLGWEADGVEQREVAVAAPWGEFHLAWQPRADGAEAPAAEQLARAALATALGAAGSSGAAQVPAASVSDWIEPAGLARVARIRQDLPDGGFVAGYCAPTPSGRVIAWARAVAEPERARADLERLLDAIRVQP